jgi:hypothetical protein
MTLKMISLRNPLRKSLPRQKMRITAQNKRMMLQFMQMKGCRA